MNFNPTINRTPENSIVQQPQVPQDHHHHHHQEPDLDKPRCDWNFNLCTIVSYSSLSSSSNSSVSDTLGATEFDPCGNLLATAGIARKIRIYSLKSLLPYDSSTTTTTTILDHTTASDFYICTPAKLSSLKWKPKTNSRIIASGDYDGVVTEYDLERKLPVFERDEHGGRRIWSIDYINNNNNHNNGNDNCSIGASGSDDGTVQLWDTRCSDSSTVGIVTPNQKARSAVCCVEFSPFGGDLIAMGCADRNAYTYDIRKMASPVKVFVGHEKTVSYVRFMGARRMVTAGIDGCLKLWDLEEGRAVRSYKGHMNRRNFVGLAVMKKGGLVGCGSESGEVFVYDERWGEPIWVSKLTKGTCGDGGDKERRFVGSVCWREEGEDECKLVAGGSDGVLQVFDCRRRRVRSD